MRRIGLLLAVLTVGVFSSPAGALTTTPSPFSPGLPVSPGTTPSTTTPTVLTATNSTTAGGGGLSSTSALVITIGAVVVLTAIALFIWRDARRRAPVRRRSPDATLSGDGRGRAASQRTKPRKLSPAERRRRKRGRAKR